MILSAYIKLMGLIETDDLELIRDFFEDIIPDHVTIVLNSTVHDETLLFIAAILGKHDICRYLLSLSLRQGREQLCQIWKTQRHPLTAAIASNNRQVTELIIHNLYDIDDSVCGHYTPLMLAVLSNKLWFIKMVVQLGADVNLPCRQAGNPLTSVGLSRGCSRFLVEQGATIDQQDQNGNTALHSAVRANHIRTVEYLVEAGANVCIRSKKGYTPLVLSAVKMYRQIFNYFTEHSSYSQMDKIKAFEILNAFLVLSGRPDIDSWLSALELRKYNHPKHITAQAQELFESSVEFSTAQELFDIRHNQLLLAYQGILVVGRIFGLFTSTYVRSIINTALIAKRKGRLEKLRELIDYVQAICQRQNVHSFIIDESKSIKELFIEVASDGGSDKCFVNVAFDLFEMVAQAAREKWSLIKSRFTGTKFIVDGRYIKIIDTFLLMIHTFKTLQLPADNLKKCCAVVKELVKDDPRVYCHQTVLHRAISAAHCHDWGSVELVHVLLEAGVDVNSKDYFQQTPLIYAIKRPSVRNDEIIECLMEHGAHVDCQSNEGFYATDFWRWKMLPNFRRDPMDLSCLAARAILDNNIPYERTLPKIIGNFVDLHK